MTVGLAVMICYQIESSFLLLNIKPHVTSCQIKLKTGGLVMVNKNTVEFLFIFRTDMTL